MSSSVKSVSNDEKLFENRKSFLIVLIGVCYLLSLLFLCFGSKELYKFQTLIIGQCQVKSIDLKYLRNSFFPRWNLTIHYLNKTINQSLVEPIGTKSERWAWIKANKYKINETYECYRSEEENLILHWNWQWKRPSQTEIILFFIISILFGIFGFGLIKFRQHYQIQLNKIQEFNRNEQHKLNPPSI